MSGAQVEVAGLTVRLGGIEIVRGVDLQVAAGEFLGILGPNGSGKSTLLACLYRAIKPHGGAIRVGGCELQSESMRASARRTSAVLQRSAGPTGLTVAEVVELGRTPHQQGRTGASTGRRAIEEAIDLLNLGAMRERPVSTLSGGERQRVDLARALAQQPSVLVLDEVTNHLDVRTRMDIMELLSGLGITVIAVLHDLDLAVRHCRRLAIMDSGRIVAAGEPLDTLTPEVFRSVFAVEAQARRHDDGVCRIRFS